MEVFFIAAFILFIFSLLLTYLIRYLSFKKNILDVPNLRSLHQSPTPRGGGLAFVFVFYAALILLELTHFIPIHDFLSLLGGIPIAVVGYCDDVFGVKSRYRMLVHVMSAIWGISFLGGVPFLNFGSIIFHSPILFFIFAVFITVWFVNLYNFMDGVDGFAGMEAIFVSSIAGGILLWYGFYASALICFVLTFSVSGFLILNWSPAKIFMGDVGSGFIGYILALLMWITNDQYQLPFSVWWILLGVFIADASYTLVHRIIQKKNWTEAHREHAYQRLIQCGFTHRQITVSVLCINALICLPLTDIYLHIHNGAMLVFYAVLIPGIFWLAWFLIIKKYKTLSTKDVSE